MTFLKFALGCSLAALIGTLIAQQSVPFDVTKPLDNLPSHIEVKGGVSGVWLVVDRANKQDPLGNGFSPSYTYLVSDFKPVTRKLQNGKWLIQFVSEITEKDNGIP